MSRLARNFLTDVVVLVVTLQTTTSKRQSLSADDNDTDNQVSLCSIGQRMEKRHNSQDFHKNSSITKKSYLTDQPISSPVF